MAENSFTTSNSIQNNWNSMQLQHKVIRVRPTWTISNFSFCSEKVGEKLLSPIFSTGTNSCDGSRSEWRLQLYPKGFDDARSYAIAFYLTLIKCNMSEIKITYKLGIVNAKNQDVNVYYEDLVRFEEGDIWGDDKFVTRDVLFDRKNKLLSKDKLTIFCEITLAVPESDLERDFEILFESKAFNDVILSAGGKEFLAHKLILTARSPVFRAMLQRTETDRLEITETDEESVCEMLRYMYTGKVYNLKKVTPRLLVMAEKYAMDGLKIMCEKALFENLSFENAAEFFILGDTFGTNKLRQQIKNFIVRHASDVGRTPGFQKMARSHPHLSVEVFCVISNSID